ncbi:TetR/AcrR family transcriptional regulator [Bradyrhizobium sp.]|uniref:TetR/AcrR family transcriptional regulator n=1 Tax=Bradyrhizobium sp. TaxID=376 RepID=UPI002D4765D2|nr:TetR family transcriptional regulator C-terminal domain-containing protein [Bradyrhizobium sp.]HZR71655.1 TetR family transcriptional regulator C-terminal domain-containing protein [Bradyrhizobium sp.]
MLRNSTTRLTKRGAATRRRIIEGAARLILEQGVAGTSLDEVMAETGVSKSQLYHYFADKDAIVAEVIRLQVENVLAAQSRELDVIDSMRSLRHWRDAIVKLSSVQGTENGCPIGSLASELTNRSEAARGMLAGGFETWSRRIEAGLKKMRERGELAETADAEELAMAILGAVQGGLLLAKTMRSVRPVELMLDMALARVEQHLVAPSAARRRRK